MYLVESNFTISIVLFRHDQRSEEILIYCVSKALIDIETRYSKMEQTTLDLNKLTVRNDALNELTVTNYST